MPALEQIMAQEPPKAIAAPPRFSGASPMRDLHQAPSRIMQLLAHLERKGHSSRSILRAAELGTAELETDTPSVPFRKIVAIWEIAATLTGDDLFGLHFATLEKEPFPTPLYYLVRSADNVRTMFEALTRYGQVVGAGMEFIPERLAQHRELAWWVHVPPEMIGRQVIEHSAADMMTCLRAATGRRIHPEWVYLQSPPSKHVSEFQRIFGCPVEFNAPNNAIRFRSSTLEMPIPAADSYLHDLMRKMCDAILKRRNVVALSTQVRQHILKLARNAWPRQEDVARHFGLSRRSFSRRLAEEGTSFREVCEQLREELAGSLVRQTDLQVTQIARKLGYRDESSFSTAFRRWNGHSPRQMRSELRTGKHGF